MKSDNVTILKSTPAYLTRRVRIWGDPVMLQYGFDVNQLTTTNFQAVRCYNVKNNTFGAVTNYVNLVRTDIDYLKSIQVPDQYTVIEKMQWLVNEGEGKRIYWGGKWDSALSFQWGTLALGGNLVQVEKYETLLVPDPLTGTRRNLLMAKLVGFTPADRSRPVADLIAAGLVHRAYCVGKDNTKVDSPNGVCWTPFYDPRGWQSGTVRDSALYILEDWLE